MDAVSTFNKTALNAMERRYAQDIANGKTDSDMVPITMRIGTGTYEHFDMNGIKNVQELDEYGPEFGGSLIDVDLDEAMPASI
jgi:hypothetical protein